tara:strand:- start:119 stop:511 length:393 start_codon:yes stop_codon:yes gene_type:complete
MTYSKLKDAQQATFNNFKGIIFAYSNKQLAEGLTKLNASKSEITMCNTGMFVLKARESAMYTLLETSNKEMKKALKDETFLQDALTYELCNHEYCITGNTRDALTALDLTSEEVPKHVMKASRIAASKDY